MFSMFSCLQWKMSEVLSPVEWESKYWYKKDQTKKYQRVDPQLRDWASLGLWRCRPPIVSYITTWNMTNMISKLYFKIPRRFCHTSRENLVAQCSRESRGTGTWEEVTYHETAGRILTRIGGTVNWKMENKQYIVLKLYRFPHMIHPPINFFFALPKEELCIIF